MSTLWKTPKNGNTCGTQAIIKTEKKTALKNRQMKLLTIIKKGKLHQLQNKINNK